MTATCPCNVRPVQIKPVTVCVCVCVCACVCVCVWVWVIELKVVLLTDFASTKSLTNSVARHSYETESPLRTNQIHHFWSMMS